MRIREAARVLSEAGVPSADHDAKALVAHVLGVEPGQAMENEILGRFPDERASARIAELVQQRAARVPLQHLTGVAGFHGLELAVGPGVFLPRPETELLVDLVLSRVPQGGWVVDLCTGSGAIAFALAQERPDLTVYAVELDPQAHGWAEHNRARLDLPVELRLGAAEDAFEDLRGQVDVVVSNPPYIPDGMVPVDPEVREHDPAVALYGRSADGLRVPLDVAARAYTLLAEGGLLAMEHAEGQGESLPAALIRSGWREVRDHRDRTERPRAVTARR